MTILKRRLCNEETKKKITFKPYNTHKKWVAYFYFVGWRELSLGISFDIKSPNIEIHVPFGFFRIGREVMTVHPSGYKRMLIGYEGVWKKCNYKIKYDSPK